MQDRPSLSQLQEWREVLNVFLQKGIFNPGKIGKHLDKSVQFQGIPFGVV